MIAIRYGNDWVIGTLGNYHSNKTHCAKGHEYNKENTYHRKDGSRDCKECNRQRNREFHQRRKSLCNG